MNDHAAPARAVTPIADAFPAMLDIARVLRDLAYTLQKRRAVTDGEAEILRKGASTIARFHREYDAALSGMRIEHVMKCDCYLARQTRVELEAWRAEQVKEAPADG